MKLVGEVYLRRFMDGERGGGGILEGIRLI